MPVSEPLEAHRPLDAYVLLGEPGAGKTRAFKREAEECGGLYVKARDFATLEGEDYAGKLLFIDGLDERRALGGDGHTPLDHIRNHLVRLGKPAFRLSCREADWLGDSDREALERVAPTGRVVALHLEHLTDQDILQLLAHEPTVADPTNFLAMARHHQLDAALRNPQTLKLLAKAVGDSTAWPESKAGIYDAACRELAREINIEHRTGKQGSWPTIDELLDAAGFISAVLLLSGEEGVTPAWVVGAAGGVRVEELMAPPRLRLAEALGTNLFQRLGEEGRTYLHRSVAEFLGARYLGKRIEAEGLPVERILAMCTGEDGGVAPDLRGLCAWLSVYSQTARLAFIDRDPLGVVLYGDISAFTLGEKQNIFAALRRKANEYAGFRSEDWTSEPFGMLSTADMRETIEGLLVTPATTDGEQAFQDCVLDAVKHGERMPELKPLLERIARSSAYWPSVRQAAIEAIERVCPSPANGLQRLLDDIHGGVVEDRDDQLMGFLLDHLYRERVLGPGQIFDYLRLPKETNLIGKYHLFWSSDLATIAPDGDLPLLLAELDVRRGVQEGMLQSHVVEGMAGELLIRTLEVHGDHASHEQIYTWLAAGQDKHGHDRLDTDDRKRVSAWIAARPKLYKSIASRPIEDCRNSSDVKKCLVLIRSRLFDATPPVDIVEWYLTTASGEAEPAIAEHYFNQAVLKLHQRDRSEVLSSEHLDLLDAWVEKYPKFKPWRELATSSRLDDWRRDDALHKKKYRAEQSKHKQKIHADFQQYLPNIREGTAPAGVMFELAQLYLGRRIEGRGETPIERLKDFFDEKSELIEATFTGFPKVLDRTDLPAVDEIIALYLNKKFHLIREPVLIGMEMRFDRVGPAALEMDAGILEKLCAFWLTNGDSDDPNWYKALAQLRPTLVANVFIKYAGRAISAKWEYVSGIYHLAYSAEFAVVAAIALPPLLAGFPTRCLKTQLSSCLDPLLKGALRHMNRVDLAALVSRKLTQKSLDPSQRTYWLGCGLLVDSARYQDKALTFVGESASRRDYLAAFLSSRDWRSGSPVEGLPDSALVGLIEVLGPEAHAEFVTGARRRGAADNRSDLVRLLLRSLEQRSSETVLQALDRMLSMPSLKPWYNQVRSALQVVRLARRKASLPSLAPREVSQIITNDKPANAGDLAAIALDHLNDIARKIRSGSTNDYKQYWNTNTNPPEPKIENDCRDALLSQLEVRLGRYGIGISAVKEGHVANEQRADVMVSYGGLQGAAIPVEVKLESYRKGRETVWTGIRTQLIDRYVRLPASNGYGIYVVFWFGGKNLPPSPSGLRPRTAAELEEQLKALLAPEDSRIHICVIDCSLPPRTTERL